MKHVERKLRSQVTAWKSHLPMATGAGQCLTQAYRDRHHSAGCGVPRQAENQTGVCLPCLASMAAVSASGLV